MRKGKIKILTKLHYKLHKYTIYYLTAGIEDVSTLQPALIHLTHGHPVKSFSLDDKSFWYNPKQTLHLLFEIS